MTLLASRPTPGGAITIALWDQPVGGTARWSDQVITLATAEGLYRDGKPALAAGDPVMLAPQIARVQLRAELHTQDGRPVGAADVAARIEKQGLIQNVRAMGDIIELTLSSPSNAGDVAAALSSPQSAVPRTGPFVLAQSTPAEVRLDAWNGYHAGRPWMDQVVLRDFPSRREEQEAFELGKLQVMLRGAAQPNDIKSAPALFTFLGGLSRLPPHVAQAIPLAIDREAVRRFAARGPSQSGPGPAPNPSHAKILVADVKGRTFALLCDRSRSEDFDAAQKIQTQLTRVGLQVRIDAVPAVDYERRLNAGTDFDFYVGAAPLVGWPNNVIPLYSRSLTVRIADGLRGVRLDALGRLRFDDAFLWHQK